MGTSQIKNILFELKLTGMLNCFEKLSADSISQSWSQTEFLDALLQAEYDWREHKRQLSRLISSKLKMQPCFEDFDFTAKRNITKAQIKELYHLKWIEQGRPILLIGQTGVGKTFIAQAIGSHACRNKHTVLFMSVSTLLENLMLARSSGHYLRFKEKITKPNIFILDDFGMRKFNSQEAQDLCDILEERSLNKSTIITTQLPIDHWTEVIPDPVIADAIVDRLIHAAIEIKITGESYRKVKAKKLADKGINN